METGLTIQFGHEAGASPRPLTLAWGPAPVQVSWSPGLHAGDLVATVHYTLTVTNTTSQDQTDTLRYAAPDIKALDRAMFSDSFVLVTRGVQGSTYLQVPAGNRDRAGTLLSGGKITLVVPITLSVMTGNGRLTVSLAGSSENLNAELDQNVAGLGGTTTAPSGGSAGGSGGSGGVTVPGGIGGGYSGGGGSADYTALLLAVQGQEIDIRALQAALVNAKSAADTLRQEHDALKGRFDALLLASETSRTEAAIDLLDEGGSKIGTAAAMTGLVMRTTKGDQMTWTFRPPAAPAATGSGGGATAPAPTVSVL